MSEDEPDSEDLEAEEAPDPELIDLGEGGKGKLFRESKLVRSNSIVKRKRALSMGNEDSMSDSDFSTDNEYEEEKTFQEEVVATLQRGHLEGLEIDGIVLECSNLKLATDSTLDEYATSVLATIMMIAIGESKNKSPKPTKSLIGALKKIVHRWQLVISKFGVVKQEKIEWIKALEKVCLTEGMSYEPIFPWTLQILYDNDLLDEESILEWESMRLKHAEEGEQELLNSAQGFLEHLKEESGSESDEESDSDSDEDSDDSSDSDSN